MNIGSEINVVGGMCLIQGMNTADRITRFSIFKYL